MVVDFHVHPFNFDWITEGYRKFLLERYEETELERMWQFCSRPQGLSDVLRRNGVDRGVVLAEIAPITTGVMTNEKVLELCQGEDMLIPFGSINPYITRDLAGAVTDLVAKGVRGLKLYPTYNHFYPNDARMYPLYAKAEELGIPVMFHTGTSVFPGSRVKYGDPVLFDDVAVDFPRLNILLSHAGRPFWTAQAEFLARLHPNIYLDIAGLPPKNLLRYLPNADRLADKIVFGSDWPGIADIARNIAQIRALPLRPGNAEKILGANALRLLGLAEEGPA